ncbi:proline--tRNA ligase [Candidatus Nomurabacteria bacterium]|jgi:prolyl-tRNA synthetase|nr:proline--tRNA ligase [Candidatus Saccharibacteria bacterium]MCA9350275.1 proline--tRNA ligase [Candidatus Saccharibacteria bacterium]MCB9839551.1 proline--tRNA ligase [Candidatus Nomurabacteria bacterium]
MRATKLFTKTSKTVPADETAKNAQLLIQAGFIHKEMAGVYVYLPLGLIVLEKIKQIVREEMNAVDSQELMMTTLQPKELWEKTDRWDDSKVDNWFKTKLASGAELGVGLTHEEPVVDAVSQYLKSYKDMPFSVYQIQNKFRNELRAKNGLLRGREFVMKDAYSFATSDLQHKEIYEKIASAYTKVYDRLGIGDITFRTKADGGYFTEKLSDEYQTMSQAGEDKVFFVKEDNIYYNQEVAPSKALDLDLKDEPLADFQEVKAENIIGATELAKHFKLRLEQTTKTIFYTSASGKMIAAVVRGDYDINEIKLARSAGISSLLLANEETVKKITGASVGYAGLINLPAEVDIFVDESCQNLMNFEMGTNKTGYHAINVNWGRDVKQPAQYYDIKVAKEGDINPETGKKYAMHRAVEVGNIFPLESKYTDALGLYYSDQNGDNQSIIMGCYGIGISRLMGVLAELFADDKGLVWPESVAPFKVFLAQIGVDDQVSAECQKLYDELSNDAIEVFWDDRQVRPGEKFADADLYGIPYRLVVSQKTIQSGVYELKKRTDNDLKMINKNELFKILAS